jgi:hypothetical protein
VIHTITVQLIHEAYIAVIAAKNILCINQGSNREKCTEPTYFSAMKGQPKQRGFLTFIVNRIIKIHTHTLHE